MRTPGIREVKRPAQSHTAVGESEFEPRSVIIQVLSSLDAAMLGIERGLASMGWSGMDELVGGRWSLGMWL